MRVYLDHNATAPVRDEVLAAMQAALARGWGNPSSVHAEGAGARARVERAREAVAALVGAEPGDVVFTSGATESNNQVLLALLRRGGAPGSVVSSAVEHPSVEAPLEALEAAGWRVARVPVDAEGLLDPDAVAAALAPDTALVTLLWGHNETGVVQPLEAIAPRVRERGIALHVDATQCAGRLAIDLQRLPVDLLSLSAHKLGGPKGVGCLVARGVPPPPLLLGGPQERGRRGGTENVPGIVGLGAACALAARELPERRVRYAALRDRLWSGIAEKIPRVRRNGSAGRALCNTLHVEVAGASGEVLVQALDLEGIAASTGSACASGSLEPSPALAAMGRTPAEARGALRFSVGHGVDEAAIDRVLAVLPDLVARARAEGA